MNRLLGLALTLMFWTAVAIATYGTPAMAGNGSVVAAAMSAADLHHRGDTGDSGPTCDISIERCSGGLVMPLRASFAASCVSLAGLSPGHDDNACHQLFSEVSPPPPRV